MSNPSINFRLSKYQIARGLQIIRQLEPNYQFTSISKLVKILYIDYLSKMTLNKDATIPQHYLDEVESLLYKINKPKLTLSEMAKKMSVSLIEEKSIKSSVEDFSPPEDWDE